MKTIIYSAIYGDYDEPKAQPLKEKPILFTEHKSELRVGGIITIKEKILEVGCPAKGLLVDLL